MRTTIKMIAERAGVSIGTVDRVLHDRPYVKAEVRERVLRVMEELDYHPNRMASALATSGTPRKLALVQPEWEEGFVRDEMDAGAARFLEKYRDYNVSLDIRNYPSGRWRACWFRISPLGAGGGNWPCSAWPSLRRRPGKRDPLPA